MPKIKVMIKDVALTEEFNYNGETYLRISDIPNKSGQYYCVNRKSPHDYNLGIHLYPTDFVEVQRTKLWWGEIDEIINWLTIKFEGYKSETEYNLETIKALPNTPHIAIENIENALHEDTKNYKKTIKALQAYKYILLEQEKSENAKREPSS